MISAYSYDDQSAQISNIPVGYKARLIAYALKNEKVFAYSTDLTVAKGEKIVVNLKEITDNNFKKLMGK